ncbi:MAG: TIGR02281 family clan AA aspartic protease [Pseudohongiellaceae bacterium]
MSQQNIHPPGKKLGQGMLITCFVIGLAGLALLFDGMLERQFNPNQTPSSFEGANGSREVVLEQNRQGHYVASGTINQNPVIFLLDTGATDVAIPASVAQRTGLIAGSQSLATTANGVASVFATNIEQLTIGNIELRNVRASIAPNMPGDTILLGMSALRQVEFSQRGRTLTLRQLAK